MSALGLLGATRKRVKERRGVSNLKPKRTLTLAIKIILGTTCIAAYRFLEVRLFLLSD